MSTIAQSAYTAGYGPVMVPVTAPGAPFAGDLSEHDMGKAPGVKRAGVWVPVSTASASCGSTDMAAIWDSWSANIGIACGREAQLVAFDSDADDPDASSAINAAILGFVPFNSPVRGVDSPDHHRSLVPVRVKGALPRGTSLKWEKNGQKVGLDLLSEGKQFVAWGTHKRTGRPYVWNHDITAQIEGPWVFPEISDKTVGEIVVQIDRALSEKGWTRVAGSTVTAVSGSGVSVPAQLKTATERELIRWLAIIPNTDADHQFDNRETWVSMAHAIWASSTGMSWGREIWLQWCQQRAQRPGEAEKVWDSIKQSRVDLDWIRQQARERDPRVAAQLDFELAPEVDQNAVEAVANGILGGNLWPILRERYVFLGTQGKFHDLVTGTSYRRQDFDGMLAHRATRLRNELAPQSRAQAKISDLMLAQEDMRKFDSFTYWPGRPRLTTDVTGATAVNKWLAPAFPRKPVSESDVRPWLDHVEYVLGSKANAEILVKWFALLVKRPDVKANWHPLIMTKQGVGKDTMLTPVIEAVGRANHKPVASQDLHRPWTDFLEARLVTVPESRMQGAGQMNAHAVMNELKKYLTAPPDTLTVERKGENKYLVINRSMWVFFTNEALPLYIEPDDRRFWVVDSRHVPKKPDTYYSTLHEWFVRGKVLVANYLENYPLTAKDILAMCGAAPGSAAKLRIAAANRDPVLVAVEELIEDARYGNLFPCLVVPMEDIMGAMRDRLGNLTPSMTIIGRHLRECGARPAAEGPDGRVLPVRVNSQQTKRLWVLAITDEKGRDYTGIKGADAAKVYNEQKWPTPRQTATGVPLTVVEQDPIV